MAADHSEAAIQALGVIGSVSSPSRTGVLVDAILEGADAAGPIAAEVLTLGELDLATADGTRAEDQTGDTQQLLRAVEEADVVVIGTPIYRATYSALTKALLDLVPRGTYDGNTRPLQAKPIVLAATAATREHFLGLDQLTTILHGFFAAHVIPPGVFATHEDFTEDNNLVEPLKQRAEQAGRALVELNRALPSCPALDGVTPQI